MILWSNVVAAVALVAAASWHMVRSTDARHRPRSGDPHRGDWPPDQMAL